MPTTKGKGAEFINNALMLILVKNKDTPLSKKSATPCKGKWYNDNKFNVFININKGVNMIVNIGEINEMEWWYSSSNGIKNKKTNNAVTNALLFLDIKLKELLIK